MGRRRRRRGDPDPDRWGRLNALAGLGRLALAGWEWLRELFGGGDGPL